MLPETAFVGLARERRREARVRTMTAEEKRELIRAKQSEIGSFIKQAAGHAVAHAFETGDHKKTKLNFEGSIGRLKV